MARAKRRAGSLNFPVWLVLFTLLATACTSSTPAPDRAQPYLTVTPSEPQPGQVPLAAWAGQDLGFEQISVEQGLSQNTVFCVLQDSKGFMWFGTEDGLNKYDGYTFTVYKHDPEDPFSIGDNWISAVYQDRSEVLWVGTLGGGLERFDRDNEAFYHYQYDPQDPQSLSDNEVTAILEDNTGALWVGTGAGLDRLVTPDSERDDAARASEYGEGIFVHFRHDPDDPTSLSADAVLTLFEDRDGMLWIGTEGGGLDRFDPAGETFDHFANDPADPQSLSHNTVRVIYQDQDKVLWVGTDGGLNRFDREGDHFRRYQADPDDPHSLSIDQVRSIYQSQEGVLWIGTWGGGLDRFDRETGGFAHFTPGRSDAHGARQELSLDKIWAINQDRSGALWIAGDSQGLARLDLSSRRFTHLQNDPADPDSLIHNNVRGIFQDHSGMLWVGSSGGLDRFDQNTGQWIHYQNDPIDPQSLGDNNVWSILQGRDGMLWIGTESGLDRFDAETGGFAHYQADPGNPHSLSDDFVLPIYQDREGVLWIGTFAGGLNSFDPETESFTHYRADPTDPHSLNSDGVMSIYEDREGALWIGTVGGGLDRLDRDSETFRHFSSDRNDPLSLSNNVVASIFQDREGTLWIGTLGGLNKFDYATETFTHLRERDGLANDVVYGIVEDDDGFLWLSTNKGLSRFDRQKETFRNFDTSDGLQSSEFNSFSYHKGHDGQIFFGGINGLNAFYPDDLADNPYIPPIVLTAMSQSGKEIYLGAAVEGVREIAFRWPNNFFEFEFAALSYVHPEKNQYAYKLEGFEDDWNAIGTRRFGRYTNLPGGTYTLLLKGSNNDGVWNESGAAIKVAVVPPFWATWWFRGIVLLVLVGGTAGGFRLRVRSIEMRSRELEVQVEQRTAELWQEIEQRAQVEKALRQSEMEKAITAERNRLARDLHDSVTQSLYSLTLLAEAGQRMISAGDLEQIAGNQDRLGDISQQALQEMRLLVYELRPVALEREGLIGALEQRLETVERRAGVQARVVVRGEIELPAEVEEELYRIAQEGLNNALKHAKASMVTLTVRAVDESVILEIVDNGRGFDSQAMSERGGLGLISMQERAARMGGRLTIRSAPGEGTRISVEVRGDSNE